MTRLGIRLFLSTLFVAGQSAVFAQTNGSTANFQEVYDLIRTHAAGVSEAELNRAAVRGLVNSLSPKVSLVTDSAAGNTSSNAKLVTEPKVFDDHIAYIRITRVDGGLSDAVGVTYKQLGATNKIGGVVLDLRYADGSDYAAAVSAADLFIGKAQPVLNWGNGVVSSHEKTNAITVPLAVLVNRDTAAAAEALAAMLREAGSGLILGSRTAGRAMVMEEFPLKSGERLRIASSPVTLGGGESLSAQGIKPDIDVTVSVEDERAFYADSFLVVQKTNQLAATSTNQVNGTNQSRRTRLNEAELVREHKAGVNLDEETAKRPPEPQLPVVSDPALARALDLLKGLAVVRQSRS